MWKTDIDLANFINKSFSGALVHKYQRIVSVEKILHDCIWKVRTAISAWLSEYVEWVS